MDRYVAQIHKLDIRGPFFAEYLQDTCLFNPSLAFRSRLAIKQRTGNWTDKPTDRQTDGQNFLYGAFTLKEKIVMIVILQAELKATMDEKLRKWVKDLNLRQEEFDTRLDI